MAVSHDRYFLDNIVDRIYIGNIPGTGALALTGVGVTFPIILLVSAFAAFAGMGGAPLASIQLGAGNREGAEKKFWATAFPCFWCCLLH